MQQYFGAEGRDPTDVELESMAQTWSEHCVHKTFKGIVEYREATPEGAVEERIDSLIRTYLQGGHGQDRGALGALGLCGQRRHHRLRRAIRGLVQGGDAQPSLGAGALWRRQHRRGRRGARHHRRLGAAHRQHRRALLRPAGPAHGAAAGRRAAPAAHLQWCGGRRRGLRQQDGHPHGQRRHPLRARLYRQPAGLLRLPGHRAPRLRTRARRIPAT